jgi:hypothetical protein
MHRYAKSMRSVLRNSFVKPFWMMITK